MTTYPGTIHDQHRAAQYNAVRRAFTELRGKCDERGHELLDALEGYCLDGVSHMTALTPDARLLPFGEAKVEEA